ncbi:MULTISPECIES: glycosyltransferase [unclassified Corynebacterium]|uniref:CgeB family protein n=1 Tax=unclassified Corynebacterium TaxID=2624378 RepID=UPI00130458DA|nr:MULTISPECIES: glycosyltransferase [unclassified Corynebacterium]
MKLKDIRVAAVLDEFSYQSFAPECNLVSVTPNNWRQQFDQLSPQLFLCESAWSGHDSERRPWQGKVYASENFPHENRTVLFEMLDYCKKQGIPTVFWNKEDPSHFDDRVHNFVDTALKFDHIFTTDVDCVRRYRDEHGHPSVHVLQFAAQPKLFNPVEVAERTDDAVFAGGWYQNHSQRCEDMEHIFDTVIDSNRQLKIYDRFFYFRDDNTHKYPLRYTPYVFPPLSGENVAKAYKESVFGITINTETESDTMFARRIFELMACNTFVLSNYSRGIDEMFGDTVLFLDRDPGALDSLSRGDIDEWRRRNLRTVLRDHTYAKRFEEIVRVSGISFESTSPHVAAVAVLADVHDIDRVFDTLCNLNDQTIKDRVIIVGPAIKPFDYGLLLRDYNRNGVQVIRLAEDAPHGGEVLRAIDAEQFLILCSNEIPGFMDLDTITRELLLHSQYSSYPVAFAGDQQQAYNVVQRGLMGPTLVSEGAVHEVLGAILKGSSFGQLLVDEG